IHFTLWLWPVFSLGIAGAVAANLLVAPTDPARLLREELVKRVDSAEAALVRRLRPVSIDAQTLGVATAGIARLETLLKSAPPPPPADEYGADAMEPAHHPCRPSGHGLRRARGVAKRAERERAR